MLILSFYSLIVCLVVAVLVVAVLVVVVNNLEPNNREATTLKLLTIGQAGAAILAHLMP
ncbi:MAG: hypothetical protein WCD69_26035 [Xanthobacteraceae bacterium]